MPAGHMHVDGSTVAHTQPKIPASSPQRDLQWLLGDHLRQGPPRPAPSSLPSGVTCCQLRALSRSHRNQCWLIDAGRISRDDSTARLAEPTARLAGIRHPHGREPEGVQPAGRPEPGTDPSAGITGTSGPGPRTLLLRPRQTAPCPFPAPSPA